MVAYHIFLGKQQLELVFTGFFTIDFTGIFFIIKCIFLFKS